MTVRRMEFNRVPFLGAYSLCTDRVCLIPENIHLRPDNTSILKVPVIRTNLSESPLLGILLAGNSNGILCSELFELTSMESIKNLGIEIHSLPGSLTALGNLILANDHGAIVSPDFSTSTVREISDRLGVPVEKGTIAGYKVVGAVGIATNRGALLHPEVKEAEARLVEEVLKVPVDIGTACGGVSFLGLCVIANSMGALAGSTTTGPELGRIESSLELV